MTTEYFSRSTARIVAASAMSTDEPSIENEAVSDTEHASMPKVSQNNRGLTWRLREILNELRGAPNHRAAGAVIDAELAIQKLYEIEGYRQVLPRNLHPDIVPFVEAKRRLST